MVVVDGGTVTVSVVPWVVVKVWVMVCDAAVIVVRETVVTVVVADAVVSYRISHNSKRYCAGR
jgi:hypothetical protein